jgi:methionyl-tRNA formyltransferase
MRIAVASSTRFGYRCITDGILSIPDTKLVGVLSTPVDLRVGSKGDAMKVAQPAGFVADQLPAGCELVTFESSVSSESYLELFDRWQPELLLVLGWYHLIPPEVLVYPSLGCLGIHASLLPKYRGMAPINWAIINGERETGISLFYLDRGVDTGDIVAQSVIEISDEDDCATVYEKVTLKSIELLSRFLPMIAEGTAPRTVQDETTASQFPRRRPEDGEIDWQLPADQIYNFIRAQTRPYPGAFTFIDGRKLIIWKTRVCQESSALISASGELFTTGDHTCIRASEGSVELLEVQWADQTAPSNPSDINSFIKN